MMENPARSRIIPAPGRQLQRALRLECACRFGTKWSMTKDAYIAKPEIGSTEWNDAELDERFNLFDLRLA